MIINVMSFGKIIVATYVGESVRREKGIIDYLSSGDLAIEVLLETLYSIWKLENATYQAMSFKS